MAVHRGIVRLQLSSFRSYPQWRLTLEPGAIALIGPNGVGKTNVLEALSFLAPGRGLRRASGHDVRTHTHTGSWSVFAEIQDENGEKSTVATRWDPSSPTRSTEKRTIYHDGQELTSHHHILPHLWITELTPVMDDILRGSSQARRRFLDHIVSGVVAEHSTHLTRYAQLVKERSMLLKRASWDPSWCDVLERQMADMAMVVTQQRQRILNMLEPYLQKESAVPFYPQISCEGVWENFVASSNENSAKDFAIQQWASSRREDQKTGQCRFGPHRTHIHVLHSHHGRDAQVCSTGEQKSLLLRWILAATSLYQESRQGLPLLLLDEMMAHLDERRRHDFFDEIDSIGVQSWLTGTDMGLFEPFRHRLQCVSLTHVPSPPQET